ncbi:MAG TPA: YerC/YecD family TrpR-related protein [Candidatus Dojkabacteria bacterium]|jgi:TrpR-related protein YerC/YecD
MPNYRKSKTAEFKKKISFKPRGKEQENLIKALLSAKTEEKMGALIRDIMTIGEIEEFSKRLEIARLILEDLPYKEIAKKVNTSTTTVTRVAEFLFNGAGGYWGFLAENKSQKTNSK